MAYRPTIGLEVHAELKTKTKMFCDCRNDPDETQPNVNICPVCLAHPGTLPVANRNAVEHVLRVGKALGGTLADYSEFDRKSYFYPDIPKGYQISQYAYPFVSGGTLADVPITRVHLEEDTARSSHEGDEDTSRVDFNRAGVPLMELVTEPAMHDAQSAGQFARELQLLLRALEVSDANLEKGEMRIEANISVSEGDTLGTKVEVKNLNSFRAVERAIAFEIDRQVKVLESGGSLTQETRGWNEDTGETFSQRAKEGSADYRYFPEPDLPKLKRSDVPMWIDAKLAASLPELPAARRERYVSLGIKEDDAAYLASDLARGDFFDEVLTVLNANDKLAQRAANYFVTDLAGLTATGTGKVTPQSFAKLIRLLDDNKLSSRGAKDTLAYMHTEGGDPEDIAQTQGLMQVSDTEALKAAVRAIVQEHQSVVAEFRGGKEASLQFLVGQTMKATKGAGNPSLIKELLIAELS